MTISIITIGNSKGIRIPKSILDQCSIEDELDLEIQNGKIILKPVIKNPRAGWTDAFQKMSVKEDDNQYINDSLQSDDFEWEW